MSDPKSGVSAETLQSISTPDKLETRLGVLQFDDGAPSKDTAELLYDNLDFMHGVEAFINSFPGASLAAMRQGFLGIGVEDNDVLEFPELMDSGYILISSFWESVFYFLLM